MTRAIFPGTFDPITLGHADLIKRASKLFDHVIVAVADNANKMCLFSLDEREALAQTALSELSNVSVTTFDGLLVDCARQHNAQVILRGIRAVADFEYEKQMTHMNRHLAPTIDTIYLCPPTDLSFVASSLVREVASLGGDVAAFVHPFIGQALREKFQGQP